MISQEEYAEENFGLRCPFCQSADISDSDEIDNYRICENCDASWIELVKVIGFQVVNEPESLQ